MTSPSSIENDSLRSLVGEKLSSVTFVLDYWQLDFDGQGFNVMSKIEVHDSLGSINSNEKGFRDRLCDHIGKIVDHAVFKPNEEVLIFFSDASIIALSVRPDDYVGPEALMFGRQDKTWWVV